MSGYEIEDVDAICYHDSEPEDSAIFLPSSYIRDVPCICKQLCTCRPYLCVVMAHDSKPLDISASKEMEHFYYRIWADSEKKADKKFMNLPAILDYIKSVDDYADERPSTIYDMDLWDALHVFITLDPYMY